MYKLFGENNSIPYVLLITLFALIIYLTTYARPFAVLDDYVSLLDTYPRHSHESKNASVITATGVVGYALLQGRVLNAVFIKVLFSVFNSVETSELTRLVGVAGTACYAALLMRLLCRWGVTMSYAFLIACFVALLPPFVEVALFAGISSYSWSCAITAAVMIYADTAFVAMEDRRAEGMLRVSRRASLFIIVGVVAALFSYPPAAQILFCLPLRYLFSRNQDSVSKALRCALFVLIHFAIGGIVFVVLWKAYARLLFGGLSLGQRSWISTTAELGAKARYFFGEVLLNAFNLFKLTPTASLAAVVLTLCVVGLASRRPKVFLGRLAVWLALIPCTYAANLVVSENWATYRTQLALQSFLMLSLALSAGRLADVGLRAIGVAFRRQALVNVGALSLLVILAARQFFVVGPEISLPHAEEWQIVRTAVARVYEDPSVTHLVFVRPDWWANSPSLTRYDSIGTPSSFAAWVTEAMLNVASWDVAREPLRLPLRVITPEQASGIVLEPGEAVVDMNSLLQKRTAIRMRPLR